MFRWLSALAIVGAIVLLRFSYVNGGNENWIPVTSPFPGIGLSTENTFELASGGRFILEVVVPAASTERRSITFDAQPSVPCSLKVVVADQRGFRLERLISNFHNGGQSSRIDLYYPDDTITLPQGGTYSLELTSLAQAETFSRSGALVRLTRFGPVGPEFTYPIAKALAYLLFALALAGQFLAGFQARAREGS